MKRLPKVDNSIQLQIAMHDLYETKYQIYNHINPPIHRPLSSVAFHPSERVHPDKRLKDALMNYHRYNIGDLWKITFLEFLNLTPDVIETFIETAIHVNKQKADALAKELEGKKPKH